MQSGDKHFLGTIVFMAAKSGGFALQEYVIIDGQQCLTTLMLILKALSVIAEAQARAFASGWIWYALSVESGK